MANKYQKPVSELQNNRPDRVNRRTLQLVAPGDARPVPATPKGLQAGAQKRWRALWASPVAPAIDLTADGEALHRWIHCVSERERLQPLADRTPVVKGSTGQLVANPVYGILGGLTKEIERLEEHFGLTPLARMRLGIATVQHAASVHDLTRRLDERREMPRADVIEATVIDLGGMG